MTAKQIEFTRIEPTRVYSRLEAAEVLNVSLSTIKRLIIAGDLRASQPPEMRRIFIIGAALLALSEGDTRQTMRVDTQMPSHHTTRPPIEPTRVYSRTEAAEVLNVSLSTIKRLIACGLLRVSQPPGMRRVFITGQAMLDFLNETVLRPGVDFEDD